MTLAQLVESVGIDAEYSRETLGNLASLMATIADRDPTVHELAAMGSYVRDLYQGLENILVRFAKYQGVALPDTADWHVQLIQMFCEPQSVPGLPVLLPNTLRPSVMEYRGFRHVFNKRYSAHLEWEQLQPLVDNAQSTFLMFHEIVDKVLEGMMP